MNTHLSRPGPWIACGLPGLWRACALAGSCALLLTSLSAGGASAVAVRTTIKVGDSPQGVAFSPNGSLAYVLDGASADHASGAVIVVNTKTDKVVKTLGGGVQPSQLALSPDGSTLALAQPSGGVVLVNPKTGATVSVAAPDASDETETVTYSPSGKDLYAVSWSDTSTDGVVQEIDTTTDQTVNTLTLSPGTPTQAAFGPKGRTLYVLTSDINGGLAIGTLSALNPRSLAVEHSLHLTKSGYGLAISPNGHTAYISGFDYGPNGTVPGYVSAIDLTGFAVKKTVMLGIDPDGLAMAPNGRALYVPSTKSSGSAELLSTSNLAVLRTVGIRGGSAFPAYSPSGQLLISPNEFDYLKDPWVGDTVTVVDMSLIQSGPETGRVDQHKAFSGQLRSAGSDVEYLTTKPARGLTVSASGQIRGATSLTPGVHIVRGASSDKDGDSGTWSFRLSVTKV